MNAISSKVLISTTVILFIAVSVFTSNIFTSPTSGKTGSRTPARQHQRGQRPIPAKNPNCHGPARDTPDTKGGRLWVTGRAMKGLTIVQYNCGHLNYKATRPLFDSFNPEEHQIIALQEPVYNKQTRKTYQLKGYYLLYEPDPATCIYFLISQHIGTQA